MVVYDLWPEYAPAPELPSYTTIDAGCFAFDLADLDTTRSRRSKAKRKGCPKSMRIGACERRVGRLTARWVRSVKCDHRGVRVADGGTEGECAEKAGRAGRVLRKMMAEASALPRWAQEDAVRSSPERPACRGLREPLAGNQLAVTVPGGGVLVQ